MIDLRCFDSVDDLIAELITLLTDHMQSRDGEHAVMLSGGKTPVPIYEHFADHPVPVPGGLHFFLSDERMVPITSPQSNYRTCSRMFSALQMPEDRIVRVHTELYLSDAAARYDRDLNRLREDHVPITLGLLGLGTDGHTASLFSLEDVKRTRGHLAVAVPRREGPDRVTVTPTVLQSTETIIFIATGQEKRGITRTLVESPASIPAGLAVEGAADVHLWVDPEACP